MNKTVTVFEKDVYLETFTFNENENNTNIIICPGGGYGYISPREGEPVAQKFITYGYNCHVLHYSVAQNAKFPKPMQDLAKAVDFVKNNYKGKIVIMGFSAGANLCGEYTLKSDVFKSKGINLQAPDLTILGYPPVDFYDEEIEKLENIEDREAFHFKDADMIKRIAESGERILAEGINFSVFGKAKPTNQEMEEYSLLNISDDVKIPPIFIFTTLEDIVVDATGIIKLAHNLKNRKSAFELHMFQWGEHGLSVGDGTTATRLSQIDNHYSNWIKLAVEWIERNLNEKQKN